MAAPRLCWQLTVSTSGVGMSDAGNCVKRWVFLVCAGGTSGECSAAARPHTFSPFAAASCLSIRDRAPLPELQPRLTAGLPALARSSLISPGRLLPGRSHLHAPWWVGCRVPAPVAVGRQLGCLRRRRCAAAAAAGCASRSPASPSRLLPAGCAPPPAADTDTVHI